MDFDFVIFGSGGREAALGHFLARSPLARKLIALPGNPGIEAEHLRYGGSPIECIPIGVLEFSMIEAFLTTRYPNEKKRRDIICVIGPEDPLAAGLADLLIRLGFGVFGPYQKAALLESSKSFSQRFMEEHNVPHAKGESYTDRSMAREHALRLGGRAVIKYPFPVKGKGAVPCKTIEEVDAALDGIFVEKKFGDRLAVVVQELLEGEEVSFQAIYDGHTLLPFDPVQDYKWSLVGDTGFMTGGVGGYSPVPFLQGPELLGAYRKVYSPFLTGCGKERVRYCGMIFPGLILTRDGPKVIEFNARFGDPEAGIALSRLKSDLGQLIVAAVKRRLCGYSGLLWHAHYTACVVLATGEYPDAKKMVFGKIIYGLREASEVPNTLVLHAGTRQEGKDIFTSAGRVLQVLGNGPTLKAAIETAYRAANLIEFEGKQMRPDIGKRALAFST